MCDSLSGKCSGLPFEESQPPHSARIYIVPLLAGDIAGGTTDASTLIEVEAILHSLRKVPNSCRCAYCSC